MFRALFVSLLFLVSCQHGPIAAKVPQPEMQLYVLENPPVWGKTPDGSSLLAGGFSGLYYLGKSDQGEYQFITHTDRGPNWEPIKLANSKSKARPFLLPDFQPRLLKIETDSKNKTLKVLEEIPLTDPQGRPLSGRPQWTSHHADEAAVDLTGKALKNDLMGIDPEGITRDSDGNYWMGEEYRPSLLKFDPKGKLLKRYIPRNSLPKKALRAIQKRYGSQVVIEALPEDYKYRASNRGFEGISFSKGKIYALLQSPLKVPGARNRKFIRLLAFDPKTETITGEGLYPLEMDHVDKIGDLSSMPGSDDLLTIEQNSQTGPQSVHLLQRFQPITKPFHEAPERMNPAEIREQNLVLSPKTLVSLSQAGYDFAEKVEGLAVVSDHVFAVINDNDFGVQEKEGKFSFSKDRKSVLGLVKVP